MTFWLYVIRYHTVSRAECNSAVGSSFCFPRSCSYTFCGTEFVLSDAECLWHRGVRSACPRFLRNGPLRRKDLGDRRWPNSPFCREPVRPWPFLWPSRNCDCSLLDRNRRCVLALLRISPEKLSHERERERVPLR